MVTTPKQNRERYYRLKEADLCVTCMRPSRQGKVDCQRCAEDAKRRREEGKHRKPEVYARQRQRQQETIAERKKKGSCVRCGKRPPVLTKFTCQPCLDGHKTRDHWHRCKLKKYGLTIEDYNNRLQAQRHRCAICKDKNNRKGYRLAVDHSHSNGQIRGFLCTRCNLMLGKTMTPEILRAAAAYLEKHGC